jgi:membrane fusion protein, copper/silver efflux system
MKNMKKMIYVFTLVAFSAGFFWIGSWTSGRPPLPNEGRIEAVSDANLKTEVYVDEDESFLAPGTVRISPEKRQLIDIRTGVVEKVAVTGILRLPGRVAPDENRLFNIKAAVDGIIQKVYPDTTTGSLVQKGQRLAAYYSPDIYGAEQGYLISLSSDRYRNNLQVQVNESRLLFLGMAAPQIEQLKKTGEIEEVISLLSPGTGFVLSRNVSPDFRFEKGDELYRIAKLDRVWILADVYESEARYLVPDVLAKVSHPQLGREFQARVSDVLPLFDPATRTLKVRLEADNPEFMLKPDMFVDVELPVKFPPAIAVPADAVLDSGLRKTVFVDKGDGLFEPREVETGWRLDNRIEILKGLAPGERIALSGTFFIDSESRLEMAAAGIYRK